ncbi:MAG TPA: GMC family oxidoreductase [Terriglobia bacterium]|nr:GMC family oxidoreductase [Terriglobia bacterium]
MSEPVFDVCVVGSGPGGGIASYILASAGLKVVLVEAGKALRAGIDYNPHLRLPEGSTNFVFRGSRAAEPHLVFEKNHFTPVGDRPGHGLLKALGGRSVCWAGHCLRFGPADFKKWPIAYEEVAPYYSKAERFMGVYGHKDGLSNLPDGDFLRPVRMRCPEMLLKRGVDRLKTKGRKMEFVAQRKAILTEDHSSNRPHCHYCGECMSGCCVDAKYTSANTPIPLALKTGNLTLRTESTMTRILLDSSQQKIAGIEYNNGRSNVERISCKALVLACSTVETARHLLLNKTSEFPNGLANGSGQVGKNLTSHFGLDVVGYFPELRNRDVSKDNGTDYFHSLLTGLYWDKANPKFEGTYQVQCGAGIRPGSLAFRDAPGFGGALKREIREKNVGHASMGMQGSLLISPHKFVDLDPERRDRLGLPLPRIHLHYEDNDVAMAQDMVETCEEIIRSAGGEVLRTPGTVTRNKLQIDQNHWVGTTRMGTNPRESVVNTQGQSHEIPNLFIADASVFPAYPEKNPTLTNIALSWRTSELLVEKFRRGELL